MDDATIASGVREEYAWSRITPASKHDLHSLQDKLMSVISDMAAKEQDDFANLNTALVKIQTGILAQNALIAQLQASVGGVTAGDQALIDQLETGSSALVTQANSISTTLPQAPVVTPPPSLHQKVGSQVQGADALSQPVPYQAAPATSVPPGRFPAQPDPGPRDPSLR